MDRRGGRGLAGGVEPALADGVHDDLDPVGKGVVPVVESPVSPSARAKSASTSSSWRPRSCGPADQPQRPSSVPAPSRPTGRRTPDPPSRCSRGSTRPGGPPRAVPRSPGRPPPGCRAGPPTGSHRRRPRRTAEQAVAGSCRARCPGSTPAVAHRMVVAPDAEALGRQLQREGADQRPLEHLPELVGLTEQADDHLGGHDRQRITPGLLRRAADHRQLAGVLLGAVAPRRPPAVGMPAGERRASAARSRRSRSAAAARRRAPRRAARGRSRKKVPSKSTGPSALHSSR